MIKQTVHSVIGPRVPADELPRRRMRYAIPTLLFIIAGAMLVGSFSQPYWRMTLFAPQYPKGLHLQAYLDRLEGDVREIDILNHYIGMRPLNEAAQLERKFSPVLIGALGGLLLAAVFVHSRWAAVLALPALTFPAGFLLDLHLWMSHFGQNLDKTAPLSSSIKPFTPPILGEGVIGNFRCVASADVGLWIAAAASLVVLAGLYFHRRAYKPLVDAQRFVPPFDELPPGDGEHRGGMRSGETSSSRRLHRVHAGISNLFLCAFVPSAALMAHAAAATANVPAGFDIQAAIESAADGAVIAVPAGVYAGPITIGRPVSLVADGKAIIDGGGEGHVVTISAPDVTLRGFTIRNTGSSLEREETGVLVLAPRAVIEANLVENALFGISLKSAPDSVVRGNTVIGKAIYVANRGDGIRVWNSNDVLIEDNVVRDSRDVVMWYSNGVRLVGNHVSGSRYGLHFMYTHQNVLERNHLEGNSVGAFLMYSRDLTVKHNRFVRNRGPSGYGLGLKDMQGVVVEDNVFVANRVGVYLDNPPVFLPEHDRYTRNVFAYNDLGMAFQPSVQRTAVFENSFIDNMQQVAVWGGGELRNNEFTGTRALRAGSVRGNDDGSESPATRVGNYWSDYRGYDQSGNGIGEMPYQAESLWDSLMDREPSLRLFIYSPAQQAVEMAAKAFPVVKPRPLFTDDAPLMTPVRADVPPREPGPAWPMWTVAVGLLGAAGAALFGAKPQTAGGGVL
jgi:nitrous oxidase accessory protein